MMNRRLADRYELGALIGQGGGARVYRATDLRLKVERAVKILKLGDHADALHLRERFEREAQVLARLRHPHVLHLYDVDMGEEPYMVTDLCLAGSLHERVQRGTLPADEAVELVIQVADALQHAHDHGVVHRDVKPANILVGPDGQALLCDFGIARDFMHESRYTLEGSAMGTFAFMAPEQRMDSSVVDGAADQYALATTLYTLLCRESPFDLFLAGSGSPRWWGIPEALVPIMQAAVQPTPKGRYPSMGAFRDALISALPALRGQEPGVPTPLPAEAAVVPNLVDWYRGSVAERAESLRAALRRWEKGEPEAEEEIRRIGHMLKGSGKSFGFPIVTDVGALVEAASRDDLGNRASELVYVLRSVAVSDDAPRSRVLIYLVSAEHRATTALVFPDAQVTGAWDVATQALAEGNVDVLVCEATPESARGVAVVRASGNQVAIVVLDSGQQTAWRARGADRVLSFPPDPVGLAATVRGLTRPSSGSAMVQSRDAFLRRLAAERDQLRVEPHALYALHLTGAPPVGLVRHKLVRDLGVSLGKYDEGLLALVPERVAGPFLAGLPAATHARCAIASVALHGDRALPKVVGELIEQVSALAPGERVQLSATVHHKRVVLVEDDLDVAALVGRVVAGGGHQVEHFVDGGKALEALLREPPDLVVLDVDLPTLDGIAILGRLRSEPATRGVPVLMLTSHDADEDVVLALELGASDHVAKPFEVAVLNARIRNLLRR